MTSIEKLNSTFIKSSKGFSLLEVLVSLGILVSASYALHFLVISQKTSNIQVKGKTDIAISYVYDHLRTNTTGYQVYFDDSEAKKLTSTETKDLPNIYNRLELAFSNKGLITPISDCSNCKKRLGLVVQQMVGAGKLYPGFYRVTVLGIEKLDTQPVTYKEFYRRVTFMGGL